MKPTLADLQLLIAERDALVRPFERMLRARRVSESEIPVRLACACLTVAAEAWRRVHPELEEERAAQLLGEMAAEAVRAFNDAHVVIAARRGLKKGETHA